jgi:anti-anti-sigma regulatory factor
MLPVPLDCAQLHAQDARLVNALARCYLNARRNGARTRLENVDPAMRELIRLCGLADVLGVEAGGKPKQREEPPGIEKECDVRDATA